MDGMTLQKPKIGTEEVRRAAQILKKYKQGKAHLESRIIDNEQFWKMRHWQQMEKNGQGGNPGDPQPASAWLVNCLLSKHADAMDCYPEPTVLPREEGDRAEAAKLTRILPVVLKQNQFKRTYSDAWWYKLKSGCAAYGVFWDAGKLGGLGDISIRRMDLLNLFWEPGVRDIQDSEHFFSTELISNAQLLRSYPQLEGKLGGGAAPMIRVTAEPGRLTLEGHAGYAPTGQDIVCAAVSALMLALAERMQEKNLVRELIMRPGYMRIAMRGAEKETELVKCGLKQLQRRFPRYVEVKEAGVHFSR